MRIFKLSIPLVDGLVGPVGSDLPGTAVNATGTSRYHRLMERVVADGKRFKVHCPGATGMSLALPYRTTTLLTGIALPETGPLLHPPFVTVL